MPRTHQNLKRLFVEPDLKADAELALGREQSNYLGAVLRMQPGDELVVFNGRDGAWLARIDAAGKKAVTLSLIEQIAPQPPPADLWYGFAPLKAGRLDYMVQKATEMGVGALQPVITKFTQVTRLKPEKLSANAIEAAEQCEVLNVPAILPEIALPGLLLGWDTSRRLIVADEGIPSASPLDRLRPLAAQKLGLLIGPEGGFSDDERTLLRAQAFVVPISLGPRILRADTAAVAALAVIQAIIGDWR
jgi:16S rRNA (uracil1498-N3)-methyltransferase